MSEQVTQLVDHYFREEYGRAVSYLTGKYGAHHLELAEDCVQEALYKAMQTWPYSGIPKNSGGWIVTVASNKMIDHFRKVNRVDGANSIPDKPVKEEELDLDSIQDDVVKMMFACCHHSLSTEYQLILTLKILGGLSVREISRALLKKEETIAKSFTRAKKKFQQEEIPLTLPPTSEIKNRLKTILHIIYLLFNEGYKSTEGDQLVRKELCNEAIRLAKILTESQETNISMTNSLLALMCFHSSRFASRVNEKGALVTLEFQDRSKWDQNRIAEGMRYLELATSGNFLNEFYVQAAISGLHCEAKTFDETNWSEILRLYNNLLSLNSSPVIRLNRAVALSKAGQVEQALDEIVKLGELDQMKNYYLWHAIKGELLSEVGNHEEAIASIHEAISLTDNQAEKTFLEEKITSLES